MGHANEVGMKAYERSKVYLSKATALKEAVVYTNYGNVFDPEREGWEVFIQLMNVKEERNLIFNPGYTHVGISCGCHSSEVEMCCF